MGIYRFKDNANMVNQNDVIGPITLASDRVAVVGIQTDSDNAANAVYALEFRMSSAANVAGVAGAASSWLTLAAQDPTDGTSIKTSFTGVDKAGIVQFNAGAVYQVRARRTDANGGQAKATLIVNQL